MASDVKQTEEEGGRYRGHELYLEDDNIDKKLALELDSMRKTIEDQAATIAKLTDELSEQRKLNSSETAGNDTKKRKREDLGDVMNLAMVAETYSKDERIRELNEKIELLENELMEHKKSPAKRSSDTTSPPNSSVKAPSRVLPQVPILSSVETLFGDLKASMEKRLTDMDSKMAAMKVSIDDRLQERESNKSAPSVTYSSIAATGAIDTGKQGNAFQSFIEAKNVEMVVEHDRQRRENNIIIHGVTDNNDSTEDDTYVDSFLAILGANVKPTSINRLGKPNSEKSRPLKLTMATITDKNLVMSRLTNLKAADDQFRKISVRDDYTPEERTMIKSLHEKASQLNKAENTSDWKVRGNPKNGLRLIKIKSKDQQQKTTEKLLTTSSPPTTILE